jgi:hypothetical protein
MTEDDKKEVVAIVHAAAVAVTKEFVAVLDRQMASINQLVALFDRLEKAEREGHNKHTANIEQLMIAQSKIVTFASGLANEYGKVFTALSARIGALEADGPKPSSHPPRVN